MAVRLAYFAAGAALGLVLGTAVLVIHADDVEAVAAEAGVDAQDLQGAMNTTGLSARAYLTSTGELAQAGGATDNSPVSRAPSVSSVWTRLAACESNGRWNVNTGNGFFGGLQFDRGTWLAYGGAAYAPRADLASPTAQIAVAERLRAARGFQPWPACSRVLGLR